MASNYPPPSPARDLVRIHKAITRGLKVSLEKGARFGEAGFPDAVTRQGFADYACSLTILVDAHHLTEDEVAFPLLQTKLPLAPYERLSNVHKEIEALIFPARQGVDSISGGSNGGSLASLLETLHKISELWAPHIRMEESIFSQEALAEVMSPAEQAGLSGAMGKYSSEHSAPLNLTVPFLLFNLEPEDRAAMAANMPPAFMEDFVMKAWKDQWAAMKPFLLD